MSTVYLTCLLDDHAWDDTSSFIFPLDLSIGDLLDCVENYHDQSGCECQNAPTGVAWVANLSAYPDKKLQFNSSAVPVAMRFERTDQIRSIVGVLKAPAVIHLVIEQEPRSGPASRVDFLQSRQVSGAVACKNGPFDQYRTQPADEPDFAEMSCVPGTLFVNKTSFAPAAKLHTSYRHLVIRRPRGFGKTTFLSMMAAYVDREAPIDDIFPSDVAPLDDRQQLLALSIDLAKLELPDDGDERALLDRCDAFMEEQLRPHIHRYRELLQSKRADLPEITSARQLVHRLHHLQRYVMITVDNYTTPFDGLAADRRALVERVTYHSIVAPLVKLMDCGLVSRSYFVGRDLPPSEPLPWLNQRRFRELTEDLTESGAVEAAFGLCASQIRALWWVAFPQLDNMPDPLGLVDPDAVEDDGRRYSIRDVLDILNDLKTCSSDEERMAFMPSRRVAFINLQPEYTHQPSNSEAASRLTRTDTKPEEWAPDYEPPKRANDGCSSEPLARHYAMLAERDEAIRLYEEDPTADIPGLVRCDYVYSNHHQTDDDDCDDYDEASYESPEPNELAEPNACQYPDVKVHSALPPADLNVRSAAQIDPPRQILHDDAESDRGSIIESDHREGSNTSTAPTSVPASLNTSAWSNRSSKRSRSEEDENERDSDTAEDVGAYSSDSDRSSSGRSVRRRLQFDSTPRSP